MLITAESYVAVEAATASCNVDVVGLFSGGGGLDIGATQAGGRLLASVDFDSDSVETLKRNEILAGAKHLHLDVRDFTSSIYKPILKTANSEKLILVGGPPCQPFSKAGYWVGNKARLGTDDPRNMIGEYLRIIDEVKPDGFILENVESLMHPSNRGAVNSLSEEIDKMNYRFKLVRANALDYGVPQKRKRVFFVASKSTFRTDEPIKTHGSEVERKLNPNLLPYESVGEWIAKYSGEEFFEREEVATHGTYYRDLVDVPPGMNYIALTSKHGYPNPKWKSGTRFWNFLLKLHPDLPSWTIAAQPGPWVGPFHWDNRRLRIPELAAIQTFPEDYEFFGSRRSIHKQIGNAVPPRLGKAMVEFLIENL